MLGKNENQDPISATQGFLFDVDGTLVLGDSDSNGYRMLPGADSVIAELRRRALPFACLTNGSGDTPREYADKLRAAGLDVTEKEMWTPASIAARYLKARGASRVLVLGMPGVWMPLKEAGIEVLLPDDPPAEVDSVLVGWHPEVRFRHIELACEAVWRGAKLYVTSGAILFATHRGRGIGVSGALVAMISKVTGKRAAIMGKPAQLAMRTVVASMGLTPGNVIVVGDDPNLEIAMARVAGSHAVAVLTGLADRSSLDALPPERRPHLILGNVGELLTSGLFPASRA